MNIIEKTTKIKVYTFDLIDKLQEDMKTNDMVMELKRSGELLSQNECGKILITYLPLHPLQKTQELQNHPIG